MFSLLFFKFKKFSFVTMQAQRSFLHTLTHTLCLSLSHTYIYTVYIYIYIYILEEFLAEKLGKVLVVMFIWTEFIQNEKELNPYLSSFSLLRRTKFEEFGKRYNIT